MVNGVNGINDNGLLSKIKQNEYYLSQLETSLKKAQSSYFELKNSCKSLEVQYLFKKLDEEYNLMNNIRNKMNSYQDSLRSIMNGYQFQSQNIAKKIQNSSLKD